jgi:hypothetical protein
MTEQQPTLHHFFYVDVMLWCPKKCRIIKVCIQTANRDAEIVKGKPFSCNTQNICSKGTLCLLTIERVEVKR